MNNRHNGQTHITRIMKKKSKVMMINQKMCF